MVRASRQHPLAVPGEPDVPRRAVEELQAEFAFEPGDLLTDRGLDDVQPLGGPAEVEFLGDGDEVPQLPQLHRPPPAITIPYHCTA